MGLARIDAIFFDIDGTLVDSGSDIACAMNFALKEMGLPVLGRDEIVSYVGSGVKDLIKKSMHTEDPSAIDKGVRLYTEYYLRHPADNAMLYPNVAETLDYFSGKRKFVLTNRYIAFADATLKALGLRRHFEEVIGGDDETCLKPSACIIERSIPRLGIDRSKSLIVGDMEVDVLTGKNSGIKTCFVTYGLGKFEDAARLGPDYVIDDISMLRGIVGL